MTPVKLLSFALLAASLLAMISPCSSGYNYHPYGNDYFRQCPGRCYINPDNSIARGYQCNPGCWCISDRYNDKVYTGWGSCWTNGR